MSTVQNTSDGNETRDILTRTICFNRAPMEWTKKHDILLCKEILLAEPYKYKKGSVNKGKAWSTIADTLNRSQDPTFKVTQRSVRERFNLIQAKHAGNDKDKKSSGTSTETAELDDLIEEITEKERAAEENRGSEDNMKKLETDRARSEEDMEQVKTTKRLCEEGENWKDRKRKRSREYFTTYFLRERSLSDRVLKNIELELKKIQVEQQAKAVHQTQNQLSEMMKLMEQQQQLLKQQQEQSQAMLTVILKQYQDQGQSLLSLVNSMVEKQ